jgi:hypothetical protein
VTWSQETKIQVSQNENDFKMTPIKLSMTTARYIISTATNWSDRPSTGDRHTSRGVATGERIPYYTVSP